MPRKTIHPQIIVLGGAGFSMEPRNPRLDRYVLQACGKAIPRICFVPTASGDSPKYISRFYRAFAKHRCRLSDLPLFKRDARNPAKHLLSQDIVYVGGGNTATCWPSGAPTASTTSCAKPGSATSSCAASAPA